MLRVRMVLHRKRFISQTLVKKCVVVVLFVFLALNFFCKQEHRNYQLVQEIAWVLYLALAVGRV